MENKKLVYIVLGLNIIKEVWEAFSNEPIVTGIFKMFNLDSTSAAAVFLSKYWLLILSVVIFLWLAVPQLWKKIRGLETVFGKHFVNQVVMLDGRRYINCIFENCRLRWNGDAFVIDKCRFVGKSFYEFRHDVATTTIDLLNYSNLLVKDENRSIFLASIDSLDKGFSIEQPKVQKPEQVSVQKNKKARKRTK